MGLDGVAMAEQATGADLEQLAADQRAEAVRQVLVWVGRLSEAWQRLAELPAPHRLADVCAALATLDRWQHRFGMLDGRRTVLWCDECGEAPADQGAVRWECDRHAADLLERLRDGLWRDLLEGLPDWAQELWQLPPDEQDAEARRAMQGVLV